MSELEQQYLAYSLQSGQTDSVVTMIHNGMSVDAILHGAPCLHWAVHYGHIDLTAALLANGAMVWYGMVWYGLVLAFERARHHHYFHEIYLTSMHSLTCSLSVDILQ